MDAAESETSDPDVVEEASTESKIELPKHGVEWIDFGMMGVLASKQRQILLDLVTSVVMQDAYSLKRTVLKATQPMDEIDHGAMLEKGQIQVRTNIGIEEKALDSIERLVRYAIRGLLIVVLFVGSCLLCMASPYTMATTNVSLEFPVIGFVGYLLSVILAFFLYRDVKKRK